MKLIKFIKRLFRKHKKLPDQTSQAILEGIKEAFWDMKYRIKKMK